VRRVFRACLRAAKLPKHFTPHSLRHTFASILLSDGEAPQFVQEALGHSSLTVTTQTYGKWLPKKPVRGGVNILGDVLFGSKFGSRAPKDSQKMQKNIGEPCGTRTHDPLIKRRGPAASRPFVFLHSSA
jgi:Phage integrase family